MPCQQQFTVLMLLFQEGPQFILLCSTKHMNLHLGTMIRDKDYGTSNTFNKYMLDNVNHKPVHIQHNRHGNGTVQRKLHFHLYYTTSLVAHTCQLHRNKHTHPMLRHAYLFIVTLRNYHGIPNIYHYISFQNLELLFISTTYYCTSNSYNLNIPVLTRVSNNHCFDNAQDDQPISLRSQ